jgi:hypothetical protein
MRAIVHILRLSAGDDHGQNGPSHPRSDTSQLRIEMHAAYETLEAWI